MLFHSFPGSLNPITGRGKPTQGSQGAIASAILEYYGIIEDINVLTHPRLVLPCSAHTLEGRTRCYRYSGSSFIMVDARGAFRCPEEEGACGLSCDGGLYHDVMRSW